MYNRFRYQVVLSTAVWPNVFHTIGVGPTLKAAHKDLDRYMNHQPLNCRVDVENRQLYLYDALTLKTERVGH
jgi:hypothetical protein